MGRRGRFWERHIKQWEGGLQINVLKGYILGGRGRIWERRIICILIYIIL